MGETIENIRLLKECYIEDNETTAYTEPEVCDNDIINYSNSDNSSDFKLKGYGSNYIDSSGPKSYLSSDE